MVKMQVHVNIKELATETTTHSPFFVLSSKRFNCLNIVALIPLGLTSITAEHLI